MSRLSLLSLISTIGLVCGAQANEQSTAAAEPKEEQQTAASPPAGQETAKSAMTQTPATDPRPATSRAEGTAADDTPPGHTPTREVDPGTANPMPATSRTEGTAADHTPPGDTPVRGTAAAEAPEQVTTQMAEVTRNVQERQETAKSLRASNVIGLGVRDPDGRALGEVQDLVIEPQTRRVTHAIIARAGSDDTIAIPWQKVRSMVRERAVVMQASRLSRAPLMPARADASAGDSNWSSEADRYWR